MPTSQPCQLNRNGSVLPTDEALEIAFQAACDCNDRALDLSEEIRSNENPRKLREQYSRLCDAITRARTRILPLTDHFRAAALACPLESDLSAHEKALWIAEELREAVELYLCDELGPEDLRAGFSHEDLLAFEIRGIMEDFHEGGAVTSLEQLELWRHLLVESHEAIQHLARLAAKANLTRACLPSQESEEGALPSVPKQTKSEKGKRDRGVAAAIKGNYIATIQRGDPPPSVHDLARTVGCNPGTVSRVIAPLEAQRKALAKEDANRRYRDHA